MDLGLTGWRVLVTGAGSGIGRAVAQGFVDEGARVVACGRNPDHAVPDGVVGAVRADLTAAGAAEGVISTAVGHLGGLDTVIAAAGGAVTGTVESASDETWATGLDVNLLSVMRLLRAAIPHLRERGGRIVVVSALSAREPRANHVVSNVSKAGAAALAKSLSRELAQDAILANCLAPGRIRSAQLDRAYPDDTARAEFAEANIPLQRFGRPDEAVPAALLLGSPRNTYITGQTLGVDGGMAWTI